MIILLDFAVRVALTLSLTSLPTQSAEWLQLVFNVSSKGILVLLLAGALIKGLRKAPASVRHLIWSFAVSGLLALPVFELLMPQWHVPLFPSLLSSTSASASVQNPVPDLITDNQMSITDLRVTSSEEDRAWLASLQATESRLPSTIETKAPPPTFSTDVPDTLTEGSETTDFEPTKSLAQSSTFLASPGYKKTGFGEARFDLGAASEASVSDGATTSSDLGDWNNWSTVLLLLWGAGVFVGAGRILLGTWKVARIVRRGQSISDDSWTSITATLTSQLGLRQRVKLIRSMQISVPLTWGVFRPVVLLPMEADEWTIECRRIVLLHELSHIKRKDCLTQMVAQLACALHWFNPLAWVAARQLRIERELACDDQVLEVGTRPTDYAGYLVEIASAFEAPSFATSLTVGMACSQLESRVRSILNPDIRRRSLNRLRVAMACMLTLGLLAPLSIIKPWAVAAAHTSEKVLETASLNDSATDAALIRETGPGNPDHPYHPYQGKTGAPSDPQLLNLEAHHETTASYRLSEHMNVASDDRATVIADPVTEVMLQSIDIAEGAAKDQGEGKGTGQSNGQGNSQGSGQGSGQSSGQSSGQGAGQGHGESHTSGQGQGHGQGAGQSRGQGEGRSLLTEAEIQYRLKLYNITPEYIEAVKKMGFADPSANQLIQLRVHGITEAYVNQVRSWGYDNVSINQLVQLRVAAVTTDYLTSLKRLGVGKLSLNQLSSMKMHSVTPEFAAEMRRVGYDNLTADQLLRLRVHGINEAFVKATQTWGFGKLSLNELLHVKIFNVTPDFARQVKEMGFDNLSISKLIQVRAQGINASFMREARALGFDNLTLDQMIQMKVHRITPDYVKRMRAAGYTNISINKLIDYKISGVDQILLKNSR